MKVLFCIIDGVGDRPCIKNDNGVSKTPLEIADTPTLDRLSKNGKNGYMYPVKENVAPESDIAFFGILGNDPMKDYNGRGPLEAEGAGVEVNESDLIFRVNFATVEGNKIKGRRVNRDLTRKEAKKLEEEINTIEFENASFTFKHTVGHRGIVKISSERDLSSDISNTDPAYERNRNFGMAKKEFKPVLKKCKPLKESKEAKFSAKLTNTLTKKIKEKLEESEVNRKREKEGKFKANTLLMRDAGIGLPDMKNLNEFLDKEWVAITGMPLESAMMGLAGMEIEGFKYKKDRLGSEIRNSLKTIEKGEYDAYFVHFKETDIPGHNGKPFEKKKMVERIEKEFFQKIDTENYIIIVTADHSTPCEIKAHSSDPVPFLIYSKEGEKDKVKKFGERPCREGYLGKIYGKEVIQILKTELKGNQS